MISQIPAQVYAVTLGKNKIYRTPLGEVSLHHLEAHFFFGFASIPRQDIQVALPEKALVDFLYLGSSRSKLFRALPEIELPRKFKAERARAFTGKIRSVRKRSYAKSRLEKLLAADSA